MAAQYQSGVTCSNRFPCGMGGMKLTNCVEVCTHKMGGNINTLILSKQQEMSVKWGVLEDL